MNLQKINTIKITLMTINWDQGSEKLGILKLPMLLLNFERYVTKILIATSPNNYKDLFENNNTCHPFMVECFPIQTLVNLIPRLLF